MNHHVLRLHAFAFVFTALAVAACPAPTEDQCDVGTEGCACTPGDSCDPGLACASNTCVDLGEGTAEGGTDASGSEGTESDGGTSAPDDTTSESSTESGETGGEPLGCDPTLCTEAYCDDLREYCAWGLETPGWFPPDAPQSCDGCVAGFMEGRVSLPLVYCDAVFTCWVNCIHQNEIQGVAAVETCIDESCRGVTVDGFGLCED